MLNSNYDQTASIKLYARGESGQIEFHTQSHKVMALKDNGNVIMGSTDNVSHLVVYGEVTANKFRATANIPWYDHVFKKGYNLMPLHELENFVNKNHHLPDMPTQQEVNEQGLDLAQMNALLLKKVEELTLYLIELKKENEKIKNLLNTK